MRKGGQEQRLTPGQRAALKNAVVTGLTRGMSREEMNALAERAPNPAEPNPFAGVNPNTIEAMRREVMKDWDEEYSQNKASLRTVQLRRLSNALRRASDDKKWGAVFSGERVYAEVAGTMAPTRIEVDVDATFRHGVLAAVSSLTSERIKELADADAHGVLEARKAPLRVTGRR